MMRIGSTAQATNSTVTETSDRIASAEPDPVSKLSLFARRSTPLRLLVRVMRLLAVHMLRRNRMRNLQVLEMQQLGDKRFVAMLRVGQQTFLIGGAATSISLLAEIHGSQATAIAPRPLGA